GDIVVLFDADDIALPGAIADQVSFMLDHPEIDVTFCNMIQQRDPDLDYRADFGLGTASTGFTGLPNPLECLLVLGNFVPVSGSCVRRRAYLAGGMQRI